MPAGEDVKSMWIRHALLSGLGFTAGLAVAAGAFALIVALKIVPRMIGKSNTASGIIRYENMIIAGGIIGSILSVFPGIRIPFGSFSLIIYGLGSGIQVGCLVMALAEIMNVFPIMFRRMKLKMGMSFVIISLAAGKVAGGLWYFSHHMGDGI